MADDTERDMRGIVRPSIAAGSFTLDRWPSAPPLDRFVDRFWKTAWDLAEPFTQPIVTFPAVNLVFQADGSATVSGVQTRNDDRRLEGKGWAFGVMFRAAGFRPFTDLSMESFVDRRLPAVEIFGSDMRALAETVVVADDDQERLDAITKFLVKRAPAQRTVGEGLSDLVEAAATESPPVTRVSDLADRASVSSRTLQRHFRTHVGVGAKLVLDRYRLQAAGELARQPAQSWIDVAQRLGYADQAHLTAAVSEAFGQPPATYARNEAGAK